MLEVLFQKIAHSLPHLELRLRRAGMYDSPIDFVKRIVMMAFYMTAGIGLIIFLLVSKAGKTEILIPILPLTFIVMFFYMSRLPDVKILKREKQINREIVFAGRFLIIEAGSGVPLYDAMKNISEHYPYTGSYFDHILQKVEMGTALFDAINEEVELVPSNNLKRLMWQMINSLRTGSDMVTSLTAILEQISKEQMIEVKKYGRKLNPLAMFYMMIAVIIPSLGITMLVVLSSFIDVELGLGILLIIAGFLAFVQFMFLNMIKFSRPAVEL